MSPMAIMMHTFRLLALASCLVSAAVAHPVNSGCKSLAIRKEWRALGYEGQKAYVDAIKCLSALPHDPSLSPTGATPLQPLDANSSRYDDVVYTHMDATNSAHFTGRFFAWHRHFLHTVEGILRDKCQYGGHIPYWDWTLGDYADIKHSSIFSTDPVVGLGTFPDASTNFTVVDGAFANLTRRYPDPHHVQRNYTIHPFETQIFPFSFNLPYKDANDTQTLDEWNKIITSFVGNYTAFQEYVDGVRAEGLHNAAHLSLGGDMANVAHSPNDPLFFLLHGQLDRLWAKWQEHDPANFHSIGGGEVQDLSDFDAFPAGNGTRVTKDTIIYLSNLGPDVKIETLFDIRGGNLCYEYAT
ncbi:hypothetical protein BOTBODRAFT_66799 [Botryobasidium botryosum FD-172 SS1]|uniref:Tyrosinase copper-binding domain-containing protein n=1 Tax=Botryobasidium botryosum (strain FD-172 SS1) TaxID=930990 RepID=A0A067MC09_BOTB1|nr:hypothetical protein BOTBODRAFT_66799 [Botryobasidium botryosum FD-172 SS1]